MDIDDVLTKFLNKKETNELNLSCALHEHQDQVITAFGGLEIMIELCLTNPNLSQYIDTNSMQFDSFKQIIEMNDTDNENKNDNTDTNININHDNIRVSDNIELSPQIVTTAKEYYHSLLIIDCNPKNSLLFKMIKNDSTAIHLYNQILSKTLFVTLCGLWCVFLCLQFVAFYISSITITTITTVARILLSFIFILYCIALLTTTNKTIVILITNTFDFWFKVYNTIILFVGIWVHSYYIYKGTENDILRYKDVFASQIMFDIAFAVAVIELFLLDALAVSLKLKRIGIGSFIALCLISAVNTYFFEQDFEWNPFNFKYSNISFKSIILSSYINLIIFAGKPIFSDIWRYLRRHKNCNISKESRRNTLSHINHDQATPKTRFDYQKCRTVHKRPYLRWNEIKPENIGREKDSIEMNTTVTGILTSSRSQSMVVQQG